MLPCVEKTGWGFLKAGRRSSYFPENLHGVPSGGNALLSHEPQTLRSLGLDLRADKRDIVVNLCMRSLGVKYDGRVYGHLASTRMDMVLLSEPNRHGIERLPVFVSVYWPNNGYVHWLLDAVLPKIAADAARKTPRILVMGTGSGREAVTIAKRFGLEVDAVDINPMAVANTLASAAYTDTGHLVRAWLSDGFRQVRGKYDYILFDAPLAVKGTPHLFHFDPNKIDFGGEVLREVLNDLPSHLTRRGQLYLMNGASIAEYLPSSLTSRVVLPFLVDSDALAIHAIGLKHNAFFNRLHHVFQTPRFEWRNQVAFLNQLRKRQAPTGTAQG